jgi:CheY-like chemotaxis protein
MGARVLVVDDSPTLRKVVTAILTRGGYDAVAAADGQQALDILADTDAPRVELVLCDFVMPRMTGYELCRRIRGDEALKALPVVLMSAKTDKIRQQFVEQTGALDAISKPFDARALLAVVEGTLQKVEEGRGARPLDETIAESPPSTERLRASAPMRRLAERLRPALEDLAKTSDVDDLAIALDKLVGDLAQDDEVLAGRADAVPLGEVLQVLQMQQQTGTLFLREGRLEVSVAFRDGVVDVARSRGVSDEFRLGRYLRLEAKLSPDDLERALAAAKAQGKLLGDVAIELGLLSREDLDRALEQQTSELVYEALRWPHARFSFTKREAEDGGVRLGLPVGSLLMEGFRRVDEWRLIEKDIDFDAVLLKEQAAIDKLKPGRLTKLEQAVLELIDGSRPVSEVVRDSHASSFDACKVLFQLLEARLVRPRTA